MTDPVCHIPPVTNISQPGPTALPAIPAPGNTIASLQQSVNVMRQVIMILTGQQGAQGAQGKSGDPAGSWTQKSISKSKVRVFQNNDPTSPNFVDIEQVNTLVMGNANTKATWTYKRDGSSSGG